MAKLRDWRGSIPNSLVPLPIRHLEKVDADIGGTLKKAFTPNMGAGAAAVKGKTMPVMDEYGADRARRRMLAAAQGGSGRATTILSQDDRLGG